MKISDILYHPIYGKLIVIKKAYSPVKNAVVWYAVDSLGEERPLDGTETTKEPETKEISNPFEGVKMVKGKQGDRGPIGPMGPRGFKGETPTDQELLKLIRPLIPAPIKGEKGDSPTDKELLALIRPLIPKVKDGKTPTKSEILDLIKPLIPKPIPGKDGRDGRDGKDGLNGLNGGGGIHKIDDATDVKITNPTDNQSLTYDATTKKWVNETVSGGSGIESVVAGNNIDVDATDPANPVVSVETLTLADISDVTASTAEVNVLDGIPATLTATELGYVDGVTSAIQTQLNTKANSSGSLTQFVGNTAHRVFYSDASGDVTELALGADGTFLKSNGASSAPSFATPAGSGDVSKVGTPVNNQVGVWTGDGTLEGDVALTFDTTSDILKIGEEGQSAKIQSAPATSADTAGGSMTINGGDGNGTGAGGTFEIKGGDGGATDGNGGDTILSGGWAQGAGTNGFVKLENHSEYFATLNADSLTADKTFTFPNATGTLALVANPTDITVPDEAYGSGWNASLEVPTKNAIYNKIETISGGGITEELAIAYAVTL